MTMFLIQSAILIAIAFILGCIIGCLLKRMFAAEEPVNTVAAGTAVAAAATATAASSALRRETAPAPVTPEPDPAPGPAVAMAPAPVMAATVPSAKPKSKPSAASKPATKPSPAPKPKAAAKPKTAPATAKPDDLKLIVGIGPVNERKLNALGVNRFRQIAAWKPKDEVNYGEKLEFPGRIEREEWVRQAKNLAAGGKSEDSAELARRSGKAPAAKAAGLMSGTLSKSAKPAGKAAATTKPAAPKPAAKSVSEKSVLAKPASKSVAKTAVLKTSTAKPVSKSPTIKAVTPKTEAMKVAPAKTAATAKKPMAAKLAKPVGGKPDNLTLINGIGNVIEKKLHGMGVFHFEQIANWTKAQAEDFSKAVGFPGRAERENWMKEAAIFQKGGSTAHAKKVEAGEIPTSRKSTAAEKAGTKKKS